MHRNAGIILLFSALLLLSIVTIIANQRSSPAGRFILPEQLPESLEELTSLLRSAANEYNFAYGAQKSRLEEDMELIAGKRLEKLIVAAETDPAAALASALSAGELASLPLPVQAKSEKRLESEPGNVVIVYREQAGEGSSSAIHPYDEESHEAVNQPEHTHIAVHYFEMEGVLKRLSAVAPLSEGFSGYKSVTGVEAGDFVIVQGEESFKALKSLTTTSVSTTGLQEAVIIYFDIGSLNYSFNLGIIKNYSSVLDRFYRESSFNRTEFNFSYFGDYHLNMSYTCDESLMLREIVKATDQDIYFPAYDRIVLNFRQSYNCGWRGLSTVGPININTSDGIVRASVVWSPDLYITVFGHEMGHSFGLYHANYLLCEDGINPGDIIPKKDCLSVGYADFFDVMGAPSYARHFNAYNKEWLGWFVPSNRIDITNETGSFYIRPIEIATNGTQYIRVRRGNSTYNPYYYYIEYRQKIGFDATNSLMNWSLVHAAPVDFFPGNDLSHLVNVNYSLSTYSTRATMAEGSVFRDSINMVEIMTSNLSGEGITVTISKLSPQGIRAYSNPPLSNVSIDGKYRGVTPVFIHNVSAGVHQVVISYTNYSNYMQNVSVQANDTTVLNVTLTPLPGSIFVNSTPQNGSVYFGAELKGLTPLLMGNLTPAGYSVYIFKPDHQYYVEGVTLQPGQNHVINAVLVPLQNGSVQVNSTPNNASVFMDGAFRGLTPLFMPQISSGIHKFNITKPGYNNFSTSAQVFINQTKVITANLTPASNITTGSLQVDTTPGNANVYLNGTFRGTTPVLIQNLTAGSYNLRISKAGYEDYTELIALVAGQTLLVNETLLPVSPYINITDISSDIVFHIGNDSETHSFRVSLNTSNWPSAKLNLSVFAPDGLLITGCDRVLQANLTINECRVELNIQDGVPLMVNLPVRAVISAFGAYGIHPVILGVDCSQFSCFNKTTKYVQASHSPVNPRPHVVASGSASIVKFVSWKQTESRYSTSSPVFIFNSFSGRYDLVQNSSANITGNLGGPLVYNLTLSLFFQNAGTLTIATPVSTFQWPDQRLLPMDLSSLEPSAAQFSVLYNGTEYTPEGLGVEKGIYVLFSQASEQSSGMFLLNVTNSTNAYNTTLSLFLTPAKHPALVKSQSFVRPTIARPGMYSIVYYTLNLTNPLENYTAENITLSIVQLQNVTRPGRTFPVAHVIRARLYNGSDYVENLSMTRRQVTITRGIDVLGFSVFDISLSNQSVKDFNGWSSRRAKATVRLDMQLNLTVINETSNVSGLPGSWNSYNLTIAVPFPVALNLTDRLPGLNSSASNITISVDGKLQATPNITIGSLLVNSLDSGVHDIEVTYLATGSQQSEACGNGFCEAGENSTSCPVDCPPQIVCGDGLCEAGEDNLTCPADCPLQPACGDGTCGSGEDNLSCPVDCPAGPACGNAVCEAGEDSSSCPADCPPSPSGGGPPGGGPVSSGGGGPPAQQAKRSLILALNDTGISIKVVNITLLVPVANASITARVWLPPVPVASEEVYQYLEINITRINSSNIESAYVIFSVPVSWISDNNIDQSRIYLMRFNGQWEKLATFRRSESGQEISYKAGVPGFSFFAVVGEKIPQPPANETGNMTQNVTEGRSGLPEEVTVFDIITAIAIVAVIVIIATVLMAAFYLRKRYGSTSQINNHQAQ